MSTPSRRRPALPPLSELDAPGRTTPTTLWSGPAAGEDDATQRAVTEERAALARAVLAERAAALRAEATRGWRPRVARLAGPVLLALAAVLLGLRLWLVGVGARYGAAPVHALDAAIAATAALGIALARRPRGGPTRLALALAVPTVLVAGTTLVQPATPTSAPAAACPAAPVRGAGTAVTAFPATARSGPGRSYPTSGGLPAGCAVAVAGYCVGDPVDAGHGWQDSRWLLLRRQAGGPTALVSRHVSGEPVPPRFVSAALLGPDGVRVPALPPADCAGVRTAGATSLGDVITAAEGANLAARVPRAANIGFAAWVAPDPGTGASPLLRGDAYRQLSAGTAGAGGRRTVRWDYPELAKDLSVPAGRAATVAVLAIGCDGPAAPADPRTAALTTYRLVGDRLSQPQRRLSGDGVVGLRDGPLRGLDLDRLTAAACQPPF